jgi:hypothetical protein
MSLKGKNVRVRGPWWHYQFEVKGKQYHGSTGLEGCEPNRSAAESYAERVRQSILHPSPELIASEDPARKGFHCGSGTISELGGKRRVSREAEHGRAAADQHGVLQGLLRRPAGARDCAADLEGLQGIPDPGARGPRCHGAPRSACAERVFPLRHQAALGRCATRSRK